MVGAWISEALARQKKLKPLPSYLNPKKGKGGSADVAAMLRRHAEQGGIVEVKAVTVGQQGKGG